MSNEIAIPGTGVIVNLDDPKQCAQMLGEVRHFENQLREVKARLTETIAEEARKQGLRRIPVGNGLYAEVSEKNDTVWDIEILRELRELGLPDDRWEQLVTETIEYKVDGRVAKALASANPLYAAVIEEAKTVTEKPKQVSIRRS